MLIGQLLPKGTFKYTLMPQVLPRMHALIAGGFGHIPYFLAVVCQMVRLLPQDHPYLRYYNVGRFGMRHVLAQAASNISFRLHNIDQILLFLVILCGLVMFMVQFVAMALVFFMQPAFAAPFPFSFIELFVIQDANFRNQDLANIMLDMVFGVPFPAAGGGANGALGFFESCVATASQACQDNRGNAITNFNFIARQVDGTVAGQIGPNFSIITPGVVFPLPFHNALHQLFSFYSTGILIVAVLVTLYFIATILAETAQSGVPFGRRFNKTWAPLRIVVAFGLLIPTNLGLNSAQYIVLYAAKYGSAFASNGWAFFNTTLTDGYLRNDQRLISVPNAPSYRELLEFMFLARVCQYSADSLRLQQLQNAGVLGQGATIDALPDDERVLPYVLGQQGSGMAAAQVMEVELTTTYDNIVNPAFLPQGTGYYKIRFGVRNPDQLERDRSNITPTCGELTIPLGDPRPLTGAPDLAEPGPGQIQQAYYLLVRSLWFVDAGGGNLTGGFWNGLTGRAPGPSAAAHGTNTNHRHIEIANSVGRAPFAVDPDHQATLDAFFASAALRRAARLMSDVIIAAVTAQLADESLSSPSEGGAGNDSITLLEKGWAGAGIWYNRISELNGSVTAAANGAPIVSSYPLVLEQILKIKNETNKNISPSQRFSLNVTGVGDITSRHAEAGLDSTLALILSDAFDQWNRSAGDTRTTEPSGNVFLAAISFILGTDGLYNARENRTTHPLAVLSGIGRSLVESSIRALGYAGLTIGIRFVFEEIPRAFVSVPARFLVSIALIGLTAGFVLFYVVPFLPFLYFFFAVGGWIKGIFEALLGAPLWALAHIRIDGNGLPGTAALNGYFLIFEVFLRPILVVFGLLASVATYSAFVNILNDTFDLVVSNTGGFDLESELVDTQGLINNLRSLIDEFFFTVLYAIVVYMLGLSSFKLIDTIPNNILRWMGQSVATFGDQREDPAQQLVSRASSGSQQALSRVGGGLSSLVGAAVK